MYANPEDSVLRVRRSIHVAAPPGRVWDEFASFAVLERWWGAGRALREAGGSDGHWLVAYEPRVGGRMEMEVGLEGGRARYGGEIRVFDRARELAFDSDWIPNRGWQSPTRMSIRLSAALHGTLVELFHYGFEATGPGGADEFEGYETGWGMTQLSALRRAVEAG